MKTVKELSDIELVSHIQGGTKIDYNATELVFELISRFYAYRSVYAHLVNANNTAAAIEKEILMRERK